MEFGTNFKPEKVPFKLRQGRVYETSWNVWMKNKPKLKNSYPEAGVYALFGSNFEPNGTGLGRSNREMHFHWHVFSETKRQN